MILWKVLIKRVKNRNNPPLKEIKVQVLVYFNHRWKGINKFHNYNRIKVIKAPKNRKKIKNNLKIQIIIKKIDRVSKNPQTLKAIKALTSKLNN